MVHAFWFDKKNFYNCSKKLLISIIVVGLNLIATEELRAEDLTNVDLCWPVDGRYIRNLHGIAGFDVSTLPGEAVYAPIAGTYTFTDDDHNGRAQCYSRINFTFNGESYDLVFKHLSAPCPAASLDLGVGDKIGEVDQGDFHVQVTSPGELNYINNVVQSLFNHGANFILDTPTSGNSTQIQQLETNLCSSHASSDSVSGSNTNQLCWPTTGDIGWLPGTIGTTHEGADAVDIHAMIGTPVYAPTDGTYVYSYVQNRSDGSWAYGCHAVVAYEGKEIWFVHLTPESCNNSIRTYKKGDKIGEIGMTGNTSSPHLHLDIRPNGCKDCPEGDPRYNIFQVFGYVTGTDFVRANECTNNASPNNEGVVDYSLNDCSNNAGDIFASAYVCVGDCPKIELTTGTSDACETGVLPYPRLNLSNTYYPYDYIAPASETAGACQLYFNMGYVGGSRENRCHTGLDICPGHGSDLVRAITDGTIIRETTRWNGEPKGVLCGWDVLIKDALGMQYVLRYGEFWCPETGNDEGNYFANHKVGDTIKAGEYLGTTGNVHCMHFELHYYDPNNITNYFGAGEWILETYVEGGGYNANYCAANINKTNLCTTSAVGADRILNIFGIVQEAAENSKRRGEENFQKCGTFVPENPYKRPYH